MMGRAPSNFVLVSGFAALLNMAGLLPAGACAARFELKTSEVAWEQLDRKPSFWVFVEREELSALDRVSRMIFAVQVGLRGPKLETLAVHWQVREGRSLIAEGTAPMTKGLADVSFTLANLKPGQYDISAQLRHGDKVIDEGRTFFRYVPTKLPPQSGRIALNLPRGVTVRKGSYPITCGVPFPKGALWSKGHVRIVGADGRPVPAQTTVRSRWGHRPEASIRWLGVDFQAGNAPAWWPKQKDVRYFVEFGPDVRSSPSPSRIEVNETPDGIRVETGLLEFLVRREGFNLVDEVRLGGKDVMRSTAKHGLYLMDHEGAIYRAANDTEVKLAVEEHGDLRTVIRAEGWYVKDGTAGETLSHTLPTDKLCKFITRIEAYAGKPYVRILNTWVLTFGSHTVRLRDVAFSLPLLECKRAEFGVEKGESVEQAVPDGGVRLIQHLPHEFAVEDGGGTQLPKGKHSASWVMARTENGLVGVGHRDTWQRFPKELEVLPDALKFHIWPAHGRDHPQINETEHSEIHKLWFAHQGREINLAQPWQYFFAVAQICDSSGTGVYTTPGQALAGVHASALGTAITSDMMLHFAPNNGADEVRGVAACFQAAPHALPDPKWVCDSRAIGYLHPYDPDRMKNAEQVIEDLAKGYWEIQDSCGDYGMWVYRSWHDQHLAESGKYSLYRHYNATHHYDAFVPWMLYARSGDPFYLRQGLANMRELTDVQMIHYDDPAYPHREFHFGQGRLVGSTRHTNGFSPWGGDHAVLGHLTCYNAVMLAHYLTGDLRLREVVVDEWQKTILADRGNPQYRRADRSRNRLGGRDVNCALSEMIDLYQLTYEPAILAHMAPAMDLFLNTSMYHWGQPLHNVLLFYGSEQARRQIVEGVELYRKLNGRVNWQQAKSIWFTYAPQENFALASIVAPETKAHINAWLAASVATWQVKAREFRNRVPPADTRFGVVKFCKAPDYVIYLPRVMYAIANAGGDVSLSQLPERQPMPAGDNRLGGWMRAIVKEDEDQPIALTFRGNAQDDGVPVKVSGPDGQLILETTVSGGDHDSHVINVPKDGKTGQYVIFVAARDPGLKGSKLHVPLTDLPEVYHVSYWRQHTFSRFYTRSRGAKPETLRIQQHGGGGTVIADGPSPDDWKLLAGKSRSFEPKKPMEFEVGPQGAWVFTGGYVRVEGGKVTFSCSPSRWFAPSEDKMELRP